MSESSATTDAAHELDQIADQLYAAKPDEFAALRDAAVKSARAEGKQALARELAKLRKPTLSAWLVNLLWRDQHEVMEQLFELAAELGRAQAEASGPALRELATQRRQIESALLRRAAALAQQAGVNVTDTVAREAQETLSAALAQPEVADEVRTGRLVKPASYSGFGVPPVSRPAAPSERKVEAPAPIDLQAAQRARDERKRAERRAAAERRVQDARAALDAAIKTLADQSRAVEAATQRHTDLRERLDQLRAQLTRLESEVETAAKDTENAAKRRDQAEAARAEAQQALENAESALSHEQRADND
jgi:uncharacterized phage infection (PIP) family protein YhgE